MNLPGLIFRVMLSSGLFRYSEDNVMTQKLTVKGLLSVFNLKLPLRWLSLISNSSCQVELVYEHFQKCLLLAGDNPQRNS